MNGRIRNWAIVVLLSIGLASCPPPPGNGGMEEPPDENPDGKQVALGLLPVAEGLSRPLYVTVAPGQPGRLYIVEQGGLIRIAEGGVVRQTPFLDLTALTSAQGERGLLGLAFHPAYETNGRFYVNYTDPNGMTHVALYCRFADDPDRADPETASELLSIPQPFSNHNGGMLAFGPDGYLYIGMGDGGSANDPMNNGQSLDTLLGKILRIDVDGNMPYAIPAANPFVGTAGALPEIWAYGLRNPWRFSFDRETGDLWIGDVGQNAREEIDFQPATSAGGENYGWRVREGHICRPGETMCTLPEAIEPIYDYTRGGSQSVTGGYVYRGTEIPALAGMYVFADFVGGTVFSLDRDDGDVVVVDRTEDLNDGAFTLRNIASFGEDENGELYIVDHGAGAVYRVVEE